MKCSWRKFALYLLLLSVSQVVGAQVSIQLTPPAGFQFRSVDVLNFSLISTLDESVNVEYNIVIQNASGEAVVEMISQPYVVHAGANVYYQHNFKIRSLQYRNTGVRNVEKTTGFLPSGDYNYCVYVKCIDKPDLCSRFYVVEEIPSACASFHADPVTPLLLSFPEDKDTIDDLRPGFTWIPPMPIGGDPNLTYSLRLVHLAGDRSPEDQINRGRPMYERYGIKGVNMIFPNQLADLERGETYAWRVTANLGDQEVARSEVWEFTISVIPEPVKYVELLDRPGGGYLSHTEGQDLYFVYDGQYGNEDLNFRLLDKENNLIEVVVEKDQLLRPPNWKEDGVYGKNTYVMKIGDLNLTPGVYTFIIQDIRGKKHYIRFQIS